LGLAFKSLKVEEVSTTCGSGWVRSCAARALYLVRSTLLTVCIDYIDLRDGCAPTRYRRWY